MNKSKNRQRGEKTYKCVCPTCKKEHQVKSYIPQTKWIYCVTHEDNRQRSEEGYGYELGY